MLEARHPLDNVLHCVTIRQSYTGIYTDRRECTGERDSRKK